MTTSARTDQDYFLVAQSMLVVAYSILLSVSQQAHPLTAATTIIACVGLALAGVWGYVSWWSVQYLRHVQEAAVDRLPEYKQTRENWRSRRPLCGFTPGR